MKVNTSYALGSTVQDILLERSRSGGLPEDYDTARIRPPSHSVWASSLNPAFSSINFMANALNVRPFDLSVRTRALQVYAEKGKAAGIKVMTWDRKTYDISARTVILSASTLKLRAFCSIPAYQEKPSADICWTIFL